MSNRKIQMNDSIAEVVVEADKYRVYWQDAARTICVIQALGPRWTWEDALAGVSAIDAVVRSVDHQVYVIYLFEARAKVLPQGGSLVSNLRKLMAIYTPNTEFVVFVQPDAALRVFANIVSKTFHLVDLNYHYVNTMPEALAMIEAHRGAQTAKQA